MISRTFWLAAGLSAVVLAGAQGAMAQTMRPAAGMPDDGGDQVIAAPDESGLLQRITKLENAFRQLNGQIEQLQFQNRQLQEQVRRLSETGVGKQNAGENPAPAVAPVTPGKKSDAFDPAKEPNAPGAPRALGIGPAPGSGATSGSGGTSGSAGASAAPTTTGPAPGLALPKDGANGPMDLSKGSVTPGGTVIAGAPSARQDFDIANGYLKQGLYGDAENGFRAFIGKYPKDRLVPDATFNIGESFLQRNRPREAAEQYLKVSTDFPNSPRAPEAMLRLGMALEGLNAHEQACATFQEIPRKYPNASTSVKRGAEREIARGRC